MRMAKPANHDEDWLVEPDLSHLITEDDTPVDNPFHERQQALLKDCLTSSYVRTEPYVCLTNVGLYPSPDVEALVPDLLLSLDVTYPKDIWEKGNRAYLVWRYGKAPDLVIEVVSNRKGREDTEKLERYSKMRVAYYAIYDPRGLLNKKRRLRLYEMRGGRLVELLDPLQTLDQLGLKLALWDGLYQEIPGRYLRFADPHGGLLKTASEWAELQALAAREAKAEAEQAKAEVEQAKAEVEQAKAEVEQLRAKLREFGLEP
jgi:Uma2 family endonuclease